MNILTVKRERRVITCLQCSKLFCRTCFWYAPWKTSSCTLSPSSFAFVQKETMQETQGVSASSCLCPRAWQRGCYLHTATQCRQGEDKPMWPSSPGMLPLHPALLLSSSLNSQGKGKGRKGKGSKPKLTAVTTATYKKQFMPCLTHILSHLSGILLGQNMWLWWVLALLGSPPAYSQWSLTVPSPGSWEGNQSWGAEDRQRK